LAVNGIGRAWPDGTSTRHSLPSNDVTSALESGVNEEPGIRSRVERDSWSSRVTGYSSQESSPLCRSRTRSPVCASQRVAYTSQRPSGDSTGRIPLPSSSLIRKFSPVVRS
jgi:hypothetical protein